MEKHILSKSTFIKGLQCEKAFYLSKFHRELKDEISEQQELLKGLSEKQRDINALYV